MRRIYRVQFVLLCIVVLLAGGIEARHAKRDGRVAINGQEIQALERSGHIIPAGPDSWKTGAGLIIAGRDPDGRTRLEHIMRHAADSPGRPKHGVFSLTKAGVIELMDEAWRLVNSGKAEARERGGKVAYTVRFGKAVGYLGGREGRSRGYPKLSAVRLVIYKGMPRVVTFFPI
jgi:hypothetical protein